MTEQNSTFSFDTWIWHTEWFDIFHGDFFSPFNHFAVISQILAKYQCQMVSVFFRYLQLILCLEKYSVCTKRSQPNINKAINCVTIKSLDFEPNFFLSRKNNNKTSFSSGYGNGYLAREEI